MTPDEIDELVERVAQMDPERCCANCLTMATLAMSLIEELKRLQDETETEQ